MTQPAHGQARSSRSSTSVRAAFGRLSGLSVFLCKSVLYGAFVWARRARNGQKVAEFRAGFTLYVVTIIEIYNVKPVGRWRS